MVIALVLVVCLVLLIIGFVAPRFSKRLERGVNSDAERSENRAEHTPHVLIKPLEKTAGLSQKAADRSLEAGRVAREKLGD